MEVKQAIATVAVAFSSSYSSVRHRKCAVGTQRWSWRLFAPTADIKPVLGAAKKQQRIFKWKNWGAGGCDGMTWGFLWRFWRRLVTSSISGMRSIRICCKQSSTNLIVSLQNCRRVSRLCTQRNFNVIVNLGHCLVVNLYILTPLGECLREQGKNFGFAASIHAMNARPQWQSPFNLVAWHSHKQFYYNQSHSATKKLRIEIFLLGSLVVVPISQQRIFSSQFFQQIN
jgi:hypothetical protein